MGVMGLTLAMDIETVAAPGDADRALAVLAMFERAPSEWYESPAAFAALHPALARIVSVAFVDVDSGHERVFYDSDLCGVAENSPLAVARSGEGELLKLVNQVAAKATRLVTFRGRNFDIPCLVHGLAANRIAPCGLLLAAWRESRYHPKAHVDLWDAFTCFGASHGHGGASLRAWALRYGLPDPKAHGSGADVARLVEEKRAAELVAYNLDDARTNAGLYKAWRLVMDASAGEQARP